MYIYSFRWLPKRQTLFSWHNYSTPRLNEGLAGKHIDIKRAPHVNLHVTPPFYSNTVPNVILSSVI